VFVNDTPVVVGLISVKPALFVVGAALEIAVKTTAEIQMQTVHFIESTKQTRRVLGMFISGHYLLVRKNFLDSSGLTGYGLAAFGTSFQRPVTLFALCKVP
jgi:hypothetical protein